MNWDELVNVANGNGIEVCESPVSELYECSGLWEPESNKIFIDPSAIGNAQVLAHEVIHSIDPACQGGCDQEIEYDRAEVRAEYGAKLIADNFVDDGYISYYGGLLDINDLLDQYDAAEQLIKNIRGV